MTFLKNTIFIKIALLSAMLFCFDAMVYAQQQGDTLREVRIRTRRSRRLSSDDRINIFSPGQKVVSIDSLTLQYYQYQTMANLLAQQVPVFVKSYGVNNLATLSFRGASAAQSQVYWNSVPMQNALSGTADISLLPVAMVSKANIVYGSSAALWGSGNVGGALMIENELPAYDTNGSASHSVSAVAGSFGQYQLGLKSGLSTGKLALSVSAFGQTAHNNFSYSDNGSELRMANAQLQSGAALVQAGYKIDARQQVKFTAWYQQYYREIPRALFESSSAKNQRDESLRLLGEWKYQHNAMAIHAKAAWMTDYMLYEDASIALRSDNVTNQVYAEAGIKKQFNSYHQLLVFLPVHLSWMHRKLMDDNKSQNKAAVAVAYAFNGLRNKLDVALNIRGELINDLSVLMPGANASYAFTRWLSLRGNVQRSFRAPTLNELYYIPGGNEQLKPEQGWNQDFGYVLKLGNEDGLYLHHDLSFFNRNIKDWIVWFGGAIWTPHNIATVHSRGLETENKLTYRRGSWRFHVGVNTSYVLATTEQSYVSNDGSLGKQIPYTPRYNGQMNTGFSYKALYVNYNHTYTGYRFITTDESQYVLPYNTGNLQMMYTVLVETYPLQLNLQLNNIWNEGYTVVNGRPMPGINWLAGIRFTL